jgi:2',3'-cyclic-nucleotide 2'-phosphodiesterase (5'-nucleotidase family)
LFRDNTFKSIPIHDVLETYTDIYNDLITRTTAPTSDEHDDVADFIVPMTHSSMNRDKELAQHILQSVTADDTKDGPDHVGYVILGGHEHEPYDEIVSTTSHKTYTDIDGATIAEDDGPYVRILKSGMDAQNAIVLDLTFEVSEVTGDAHTQAGAVRPRLVQIESELVNLTKYESSSIAQEVVDKHMSVITALENEIIVDVDEATHTTTRRLPPGKLLSSEGTRFQQTTVGGIFCQVCCFVVFH